MIAWTISRGLRPVDRVLQAFDQVEQGDYAARLPAFDLPEWERLALKFNRMLGVLARSRTENRQLVQRTLAIQEEERRGLARELHDELGQSVTAIKALAFAQLRRVDADPVEAQGHAQAILEISERLQAAVGGMMRQLRPVALDQLGLVPALQQMADDFNGHHSEIFCSLMTQGAFDTLNDATKISLYRIAQESLNNAAKHSGASKIMVELSRSSVGGAEEAQALQLRVRDDGIGFDPQRVRRGLGLMGMQERTAALGGDLAMATALGQGVELRISLPLAAVAEGQA